MMDEKNSKKITQFSKDYPTVRPTKNISVPNNTNNKPDKGKDNGKKK